MKTEYTELANYKVISFDKIPSTQTYAYDMIAAGRGADHIAILADAQSAGINVNGFRIMAIGM